MVSALLADREHLIRGKRATVRWSATIAASPAGIGARWWCGCVVRRSARSVI